MITYLIGDATHNNQLKNYEKHIRILPHIVNREGKWGSGYVIAISKKWKEPEKEYRAWFKNYTLENKIDKLPLGAIQIVEVQDDFEKLYVINMVAQEGFISNSNPVPLKYSALAACLNEVKKWLDEKRVVEKDIEFIINMPRIGSVRSGGNWKKVEEIINVYLNDEHVFIYDLI